MKLEEKAVEFNKIDMSKRSVPIAKTSLTEDEINSVLEPLRSGWIVQGPKVKEFENKWSTFTKSKIFISCDIMYFRITFIFSCSGL